MRIAGRLSGSVRSLRAAAGALEKNAPPEGKPPEAFDFSRAYRALTAGIDSGPELP